ncbi:MAG: type IV pilus secretin PilQ [Gammaproteobacteria bacterium]|nr:type IV pilus secretin PilQ [Gammaproteobacteria bacterium]
MNHVNPTQPGLTCAYLRAGSAFFFGFLMFVACAASASAADLTALKWEDSKGKPTLEVHVEGNPPFETQVLDDGRRLRLGLANVTLGKVDDIEGRGGVKGVYPFLAEGGNGVNVDFTLNDPGKMNVEATAYGYRVVVDTGGKKAAAPTQPAVAMNAIEDVVYSKLPGDRVQIQLRMSGTPAAPAVFTTSNPARIAFDFPNTRVATPKTNVKVGVGVVTAINAIEGKSRTRIVVNLVRSAGYTVASDKRNFTITVDRPVSDVTSTKAPKTTRFAEAQSGKHNLKAIDFRRGSQADGKIVIGLSDTGVGIDIREQAGEIIVDFLDTSVPAQLQRRLDVTDFGTPVTNIDTYSQGKNVRMVITAKGKYEHLAYQAGDVFTVNIKPVIEKPGEKKKDEFGYSGEKLSLNFQNIEVRAALQVIADFTGLNFVTSDTVKGSLTLRLKDVPWDQALDIIASAKSLAIRKNGNVITVGPADEVAAKEKAQLESGKAALELEPLTSELIQINYAKAEDMAELLKSIKAVGGGGQAGPFTTVSKIETTSNSLLSPRGQVTVDKRTNTLLVQDVTSKIREIRRLISQLDQPVRQVMIETRLVEATDSFAKSLGVRWSAVHRADPTKANQNQTTICGTIECQVEILNGAPVTLNNTGLSVNLAAGGVQGEAAGSLAVTLAKLANGNVLALELSALEAEGKGKVISSPRLITSNQAKARIEQGQEGLFRALSAGVGGTSFVIRKAVLALEVTPQITPDERVILDVTVTKDRFTNPDSGLIDKKEIKTQVLLSNGETIVIGGVYEQIELTSSYKVPFFGDLPLLGWMFRKKVNSDNRTELLIFLTPRILSENISLK